MTENTPDPSIAILQQGIESLRQSNAQANADLSATLNDLRERLQTSYSQTAFPTNNPPAVEVGDDLYAKRSALYASQWASEVITAAALDETYKDKIQETARQVLQENGMLPPDTDPEEPVT